MSSVAKLGGTENGTLWLAKVNEIIETLPVSINLYSRGMRTTNTAAQNTAIVTTALAEIATAGGGEVMLLDPGVYLLEQGSTATHNTLRSCMLVPSNCRIVLGKATTLKAKDNANSYLITNSDPTNRNENIEIIGGIWDGNAAGNPNSGNPGDHSGANVNRPNYGFLGRFSGVSNLRMTDITCLTPTYWCWSFVRVTKSSFERFYFDDCDRDGIHFEDCQDITIRDIAGECHDNMIALGTNAGTYFESNFRYMDGTSDLVAGDIRRILIENVNATNCNGPIRMFGSSSYVIDSVTIRNVKGTTSSVSIGGVQLIEDSQILPAGPKVSNLTIEDIGLETQVGEPAIFLGGQNVHNVAIKNVRQNTGQALALSGVAKSIVIENVTCTGSTDKTFQIGTDSASLVCDSLIINNVNIIPVSSSSELFMTINASSDIKSFSLDNLNYKGNTTASLITKASGAVQKINCGKINVIGGQFGIFSGKIEAVNGDIYYKDNPYLCVGGATARPNSLLIAEGTTTPGKCLGGGSVTCSGVASLYIPYTMVNAPLTSPTPGGVGGSGFSYSYVPIATLPRGAVITGLTLEVLTAAVGNPGTVELYTTVANRGTLSIASIAKSVATITPLAGTATDALVIYALFTSSSGNWLLTAGAFNVSVRYEVSGCGIA